MLQSLSRFIPGLNKKGPGVGLEITPNEINVAKLKPTERGYQLLQYASKEVPDGIYTEGKIDEPPALADLIKETFEENNIKAKRVATAVPMRDAIIRMLDFPSPEDDDELEQAVKEEAPLYLPYPMEEVDLDFQKLGYFTDDDGIEKIQVLMVATRKEVTNVYMDIFGQAELGIDTLEINTFAMIRTLREQLRQYPSQEAVVLVDIEFDSTELAIIVDGVPQFNRTIPIGAYQLQSALSQAMKLPPNRNFTFLQETTLPDASEESQEQTAPLNPGMDALQETLSELTDEVRRSVDFYLNQSDGLEIVQMFLAGGGAGIGKLDSFFEQRLNIPTTQVDPVEALSLETEEEIPLQQRPGLATVLGLGLKEA